MKTQTNKAKKPGFFHRQLLIIEKVLSFINVLAWVLSFLGLLLPLLHHLSKLNNKPDSR